MTPRSFGHASHVACLLMAGLLSIAGALLPDRAAANGWEHAAIPFEALIEALDVEDATTRARAAQSLGFRGQPEAVEALLRTLARPEEDPGVRGAIYTALGALGDPRALPVLRSCLRDEARQELRGDCAAALGSMARPDGLPDLLIALKTDRSILVRSRAVDALGHYADARAVAALADLLAAGSSRGLRPRAIRALGRSGSRAAVRPLLDALATATHDAERMDIAVALMRLGAPEAVDPLGKVLETTADPALRAVIAAALGASREGAAYPTLVRMLGEESPTVRFVALQALRTLGRAQAARPIADLATEIAARLDALSDAELIAQAGIHVADLGLQTEALRALSELGPSAGLHALLRAAPARPLPRDSAAALQVAQAIYERRRVALYGLGYTGAPEAAALLAGPAGIGDPDPRLRASAVRSLGVLGRSGAVELAIGRLRDEAAEVRWTAATVLGRLRDRAAVAPLRAGLDDPVAEVRKRAALALGYLGDPRARAELARIASGDENPAVRDAAAYAARLLGAAE